MRLGPKRVRFSESTSETFTSGKRNNLEDSSIIELERSGLLGPYERKLNPVPRFAEALSQDQLEAMKDQFLLPCLFWGKSHSFCKTRRACDGRNLVLHRVSI